MLVFLDSKCKPKISDDEAFLVVEKQVLGLNVSVYDSALVQVLQALE